jgi:WD40 repeat protein
MLALSSDGRLVMSASNDQTARFWDASTGAPIGRELAHRGEVFVAAFSPDDRLAVTGGYDATARLWEVPSGRPYREPMRHQGVIMAADFSADGKRLLTGSADRSARLWDVMTCLPLCPPLEHGGAITRVGLHPSGLTAITNRLWRLPRPLPDEPPLIDLWTKLATQRTFTAGDNIEWVDAATLAEGETELRSRTGKAWSEWAE